MATTKATSPNPVHRLDRLLRDQNPSGPKGEATSKARITQQQLIGRPREQLAQGTEQHTKQREAK
uniref:Uncharacterized protein n=1 Tax=Oryza punctata TaxID=4537 RepID=A0A0E0KB26_ORYPU